MPNKRPSELSNLVTTPSEGAVVMLDVPAPGESEQILVSNLLKATPPPPTEQPASGNFLVVAPSISHVDDLDIAVGTATYNIGGVPFVSPAVTLTLGAADATHPRIDAIVLNTSGVAAVVAGTPAASPVRPAIDPSTQLDLTFVTVAALATEPSIASEPVYLENTEWTTTASNARIDPDSAVNPHSGAKSIRFNAAIAGDNIKFVDSAMSLEDYELLTMWVTPVTWVSQKQLQLQCYASNVAKGNIVVLRDGVYGLVRTDTGDQLIAIPTSAFGVAGITIDEIRATVVGGNTALSCFIDDIALQAGLSQVVVSDRLRDRGAYDADKFYSINDLANDGTDVYKCTQPGKGHTPASSPTYWVKFAAYTGGGGSGSKTLAFWRAIEGEGPSSNFATPDTRNSRTVMDFDASTSEKLRFPFKVKEGADLSAGIRVITEWKATSATSGNIGTTTAFERGNTDSDSDSFAAGKDSSGVAVSGTSGISVFVTTDHDETEIDGLAAGESGILEVARNVGVSSNHSGDAELVTVEIQQLA